MQRITEILRVAAAMASKARYLCASAFMVTTLVISAAPAQAQDYYGPTYGPNGPYYGPYDYCVWSPYACEYY